MNIGMQDFMGFLHLGWEIAAREDIYSPNLSECGPAWAELAKHVDLTRPGMPAVVRTMGWQPLHLAAMEGQVSLVKRLVQQHGCNMLERSANSWTPMHYAAAHNQVCLHVSVLTCANLISFLVRRSNSSQGVSAWTSIARLELNSC